MSKYEQLIEYIINEQEEKARELFHQIVVEKSREIYESLIDESDLEEMGNNPVDAMVDEITSEEQGMSEGEDEMDIELDSEEDNDGMDMDGEMGDDMGGEGELEDRVMDLEDALDELKAEFDALMSDEAGEEEHGDMDMDAGDEMGMGDEGGEEDMMEADDEEADEEDDDEEEGLEESKSGRKMTEAEWIREYVEKIAAPSNTGTDEVGTGGSVSVQAKSPVAGPNNMGGKAVGGSPAETVPTGPKNPSNAYTKGQGTINSGNKNVPGANAAKIGKAPAAKKGEEGAINKKSIES